jgi:imidazolonepropionase-like amidohydrolase
MRTPIALSLLLVVACGTSSSEKKPEKKPEAPPAPPLPALLPVSEPNDPPRVSDAPPVLLTGARIYTLTGETIDEGYVLVVDGRIKSVDTGAPPAAVTSTKGVTVIDARGKFITPGIIDTHSHMGVYPFPSANAHLDGNEATSPVTSEVWAEHSFWPQDPALVRALAGGVTTIQVLPGSANLIGGRSFVAKMHLDQTSARAMRFPGAPQGLKMACGENPKRVYMTRGPSTRMGNVAGYRAAFQKAVDYRRRWQKWERDVAHYETKRAFAKTDVEKAKVGDPPDPPARDFQSETLMGVLDGKILVHNHCYRADEMAIMLDLAEQYGFHIRSFHHALEAYKLRDRLAKAGTATSTWADWWGFKLEAYDGIPYNAALLHEAGARTIIHSDSSTDVRRLNQEAAKALAAGRELGIALTDEDALAWITKNAAWALGVDDQVGTIAPGKMADLVVWNAHPLSVYARAERVLVDGVIAYERRAEEMPRPSDFEVGR